MKSMFCTICIFVVLGITQLLSTSLPRRIYFPECQIQISAPEKWYVRNSTQSAVGMLFISKEEIVGPSGKFLTGVSIYTNFHVAMKKTLKDTDSFAKIAFSEIKAKKPRNTKYKNFEVETGLGKFLFLEINEKIPNIPIYADGVLKTEKGAFKVVIEAPAHEWETSKPMLLDMVKSLKLLSSGRSGDEIVYSNFEHLLSKRYAQIDNRKRETLLGRFNKLRLEMDGREYWKIMEYDLEKKESGLANHTPGWVRMFLTSVPAKAFNYIDVYGVSKGCVCEELFYVQIEGGKTVNLKRITRTLPDGFDVEEWERLLAGIPTDQDYVKFIFSKINGWKLEKNRAVAAFTKIKEIGAGTSEMDYLNAAQGFYIHLALNVIRVIPGVLNVNGPRAVGDAVRTEYVYAFYDNGKIVPLGKVVILNGKVQKVETG